MQGAVKSTWARVLYAAALSVSLGVVQAQEGGATEGMPFRRTVLALFNTVEPLEEDWDNPVHTAFELPLHWLGMRVRAHDISSGPPPEAWLEDCAAVATVFVDNGRPAPEWLWPFLERAVVQGGRRVLHLRSFGPLEGVPTGDGVESEAGRARLRSWLARLGLEPSDGFARGFLAVEAELLEPEKCAYELDPTLDPVFGGPRSISDQNRPWIRLRLRSDPAKRLAHPVVVGPWGGIALDPWVQWSDEHGEERHWHLDPFAFFREALGLEGVPAPEPNLINGRRIFFLHVDGDGFESLSQVRRDAYCASILDERVLGHFDLPFTVSIIVASLTDDIAVVEPTERMRIATRILMRPNVEAASHTVLHPLIWRPDPGRGTDEPTKSAFKGLANYTSTQVAEVRESVRFIDQRLLERGKRCEVVLWSGDTSPSAEAIAETYRSGCLNLNGGTFRWDDYYNSSAFVRPYLRRRGEAVQVYCGMANENDYAGFFTSTPGAYFHVDQTITNTGRGRILKPANVYIHFYSAYNPRALRSVEQLIERWVYRESTIPVHASRFARAVLGFDSAKLFRRADGGWEVREHGQCTTLRFDGEARAVDMARSSGVLGFRRSGESTFVHLSGDGPARVLFGAGVPSPYVEESNCHLDVLQRTERHLALQASGWNPRILVLGGLPAEHEMSLHVDGAERRARTDAGGRLELRLEGSGRSRIEVRLP